MENDDSAVQDFLEILEEHRKNCERQGKYVEAEIAKNRLEELKLHEENRRRVMIIRPYLLYINHLPDVLYMIYQCMRVYSFLLDVLQEAMRSRQIAERLGVEEAHMLEFQQFNLIWDKKMAEYEQHAEELVEAMKERHGAELRDYQRKLMTKQIRPKFSKDLLNLRKIQDTLAKQKEYVSQNSVQCSAYLTAFFILLLLRNGVF